MSWSKLISSSHLEDEIKAQVQPLTNSVTTPTAFKGGGYKAAREHLSLLAVLFGVVSRYDEQVRWRKDAAGLSALYARAGFNSKVGTDNSFKEARLRSQDLAELIRGGSVEVAKVDAPGRWADVANRPPLMKRMEIAQRDRLSPWTADAASFRKNRDALLREAQLLLVICEVILDEGYEFADDSTYREYVQQMKAQCRELIEATGASELPRAQSAVGRINQSCTACHGDFRS